MVLKDELIMLFQFYFNDFCRFRKRKEKDRRRRGKRAEGRRQLVYTPSKTDSPQEVTTIRAIVISYVLEEATQAQSFLKIISTPHEVI